MHPMEIKAKTPKRTQGNISTGKRAHRMFFALRAAAASVWSSSHGCLDSLSL